MIYDLQDDLNYLHIEANLANNKVPHKLFEKGKLKNNFRDFLIELIEFTKYISKKLSNFLQIIYQFKKYYFKNFIKNKDLYFNNISWMDYDNKEINWSYNNFQGFTKNGMNRN